MDSLKKQTHTLLINEIKNLPPLLFEEIIGTTKQQIIDEVHTKYTQNLRYYIPYLIQQYMEEYIKSKTNIHHNIPIYSQIPKEIQDICFVTSEHIVDYFEDKLIPNNNNYNNYYEEDDGY